MTHPNFKAAVMAMIDTVDDTGFDSQSVEFWEAALFAALQKLDTPSPNPLPTTEGVTQGFEIGEMVIWSGVAEVTIIGLDAPDAWIKGDWYGTASRRAVVPIAELYRPKP